MSTSFLPTTIHPAAWSASIRFYLHKGLMMYPCVTAFLATLSALYLLYTVHYYCKENHHLFSSQIISAALSSTTLIASGTCLFFISPEIIIPALINISELALFSKNTPCRSIGHTLLNKHKKQVAMREYAAYASALTLSVVLYTCIYPQYIHKILTSVYILIPYSLIDKLLHTKNPIHPWFYKTDQEFTDRINFQLQLHSASLCEDIVFYTQPNPHLSHTESAAFGLEIIKKITQRYSILFEKNDLFNDYAHYFLQNYQETKKDQFAEDINSYIQNLFKKTLKLSMKETTAFNQHPSWFLYLHLYHFLKDFKEYTLATKTEHHIQNDKPCLCNHEKYPFKKTTLKSTDAFMDSFFKAYYCAFFMHFYKKNYFSSACEKDQKEYLAQCEFLKQNQEEIDITLYRKFYRAIAYFTRNKKLYAIAGQDLATKFRDWRIKIVQSHNKAQSKKTLKPHHTYATEFSLFNIIKKQHHSS